MNRKIRRQNKEKVYTYWEVQEIIRKEKEQIYKNIKAELIRDFIAMFLKMTLKYLHDRHKFGKKRLYELIRAINAQCILYMNGELEVGMIDEFCEKYKINKLL